MRASVIQEQINGGLSPFALCRVVSKHIRAQHKRGDRIGDLIDAAFQSLSHSSLSPSPYTLRQHGVGVDNTSDRTAVGLGTSVDKCPVQSLRVVLN